MLFRSEVDACVDIVADEEGEAAERFLDGAVDALAAGLDDVFFALIGFAAEFPHGFAAFAALRNAREDHGERAARGEVGGEKRRGGDGAGRSLGGRLGLRRRLFHLRSRDAPRGDGLGRGAEVLQHDAGDARGAADRVAEDVGAEGGAGSVGSVMTALQTVALSTISMQPSGVVSIR